MYDKGETGPKSDDCDIVMGQKQLSICFENINMSFLRSAILTANYTLHFYQSTYIFFNFFFI